MDELQVLDLLSDPSVYIHYTDESGHREIEQTGVIKHSWKGFVYLTQEAFTQEEAFIKLFAAQHKTHAGRGSYIVVFRVDPGLLVDKMEDLYEFRVYKSIRLDQHEILYSGKNLFDS